MPEWLTSTLKSLYQVPLAAGASLYLSARRGVEGLLGLEKTEGFRVPEALFGTNYITPDYLLNRTRENISVSTAVADKFLPSSIASPLGFAVGASLSALEITPPFVPSSRAVNIARGSLSRLAKVTSPRAVEEILSVGSDLPTHVRRDPKLLKSIVEARTEQEVLSALSSNTGRKIVAVDSLTARQARDALPSDVTERVTALRESLGLSRKPKVTWREVEDVAAQLATTPDDLVRAIREGKLDLSVKNLEALRARSLQLIREEQALLRAAGNVGRGAPVPPGLSHLVEEALRARNADEFVTKLKEGDYKTLASEGFTDPVEFYYRATGNTDVESFLRDVKLYERENEIAQLVWKERELASEAGRTLNILRKTPAHMGPDEALTYWRYRFQRDVGRPLKRGEWEALRDIVLSGDAEAAAKFVAVAKRSGNLDKFISLYKAGLLATFRTLGVNAFGNALMLAMETLAKYPAAGFEFVAHKLGWVPQRTIAASARGLNLKRVWSAAREAWKSGELPRDVVEQYSLPQNVRFENRYAQMYVDAVFNALSATDAAAKRAAFDMAIVEQGIAAGKTLGLKGEALNQYVREFLVNPPDAAVTEAIRAAERVTFTQENVISTAIAGVKRTLREGKSAASQAAYAAAEFLIPFDRTPTNVAIATAIDYTPLGFIKAVTEFFGTKTMSQRQFFLSLGRASEGTVGLIALGYWLAKSGYMTGGFHGSQSRREDEYAHALPYSINLNGTWWQVNRLAPAGSLLGLGADLHWYIEERQGSTFLNTLASPSLLVDTITEAAKMTAGQLASLPFLTNLNRVADLLEAYQSAKDQKVQAMLGRTIASIIPGPVRDLARFIDPTLKQQESIEDAVLSQLPFLSKKVVPLQDVWGQPVEIPGGRLRAIDVLGHRKDPNDPVLNEARNLGVPIGTPSRLMLSTIPLEPEEYYVFHSIQGKVLRATLQKLIDNPEYRALPYEQRAATFMYVKRRVREYLMREVGTRVLVAGLGLDPEKYTPDEVYEAIRLLRDRVPDFTQLKPEQRRERLQKLLILYARSRQNVVASPYADLSHR